MRTFLPSLAGFAFAFIFMFAPVRVAKLKNPPCIRGLIGCSGRIANPPCFNGLIGCPSSSSRRVI